MVGMTDRILFNPKTNSVLSTMDNSRSAIALATTDFIGSSGRTYMEYKRDTNGGRERLYEEFLTWIIWGFGIKTAKSLYDKAMTTEPMRKRFGIEFPSMDVDLLQPESGQAAVKSVKNPKWNENFGGWLQSKIFPEVTQTLNAERVADFVKHTTNKEYQAKYEKLHEVVSDKKFNQKYYRSNLAKFSIATLAPVLLIALGIPTLNQWITRKKLDEQKAKQAPAKATPSPTPQAHPNGFGGFAYRANPMQPSLGHSTASPFNASLPGQAFNLPSHSNAGPFGFQPAMNAVSPSMTPSGTPFQQQALWPQQPHFASKQAKGHQKNSPQFGSVSSAVQKMASGSSLFLQNDQWNTLLVDNTITAGRLYKGRNTMERIEILFRELSIIGFLYFARKPIQNAIGKFVSRMVSGNAKIPVEMEFKTIKSLIDQKGLLKNFQSHLEPLIHNPGQFSKASQMKFKSDAQIVEAIQDEFLYKPTTKNGIFGIAKEIGWIPTMDAKKEFLDLTQKIDIDAIKTMAQSVTELSLKAKNDAGKIDAGKLETLLKKAMQIRATAWLLSNVACFAYLSWLVPEIQHKITRYKTGKDFFPGTQGYEAQGVH